MATSCCRQQASAGAASAPPQSARITYDSAQDSESGGGGCCCCLRDEPETAVHQDHRQESRSGLCGRSSSTLAGRRTSERVGCVREAERSRPLYGRQGVMQPPGHCSLERTASSSESSSNVSQSVCDRLSLLLSAPIVSILSKQMPSFAPTGSRLARESKLFYQNQSNRVALGPASLLFTVIYLMLGLELGSASLMSAIVSGANGVNQHPGNLKATAATHTSESSLEGSSKLARQILASHYQNQILSHIQSQVADHNEHQHQHEQQSQPHHQATTNAAWPHYEEFGASQSQYGAHQQGAQDALAPAEMYPWASSSSEHQAARNHPEPPVNRPHQSGGRPAQANQLAQPTTPTLNKQLAPPPPFYDFGSLMPTNVLQLESVPAHTPTGKQGSGYEQAHNNHHHHHHHLSSQHVTSPMASVINGMQDGMHHHHQMMQTSESAVAAQLAKMPAHNSSSSGSASGSNRDSRAMMGPPAAAAAETLGKSSDQLEGGEQAGANSAADGVSSSNSHNSDSKFDNNNHDQQQSGPVDKGIEPRQRRRMFNRILKKAEWNHLFVELSKVFLRYFLDLALKDIIGKQSGSLGSSSSSGSDSTTGRKKLDAQSELADMLKEFVKTAISNLR